MRVHRGLSSRIYMAFLAAAALPVMVAGLVGIHYSLEALKDETLLHLERDVSSRAASLGRFFDQVTGELVLLTQTPVVGDLADALSRADAPVRQQARERVERLFLAFVRAYPHVYQLRYLDIQGQEFIRVDRQGQQIVAVAPQALQDKSDRYYVQEAQRLDPGQVYVSPLDLNIEHGQVEVPERPVIRFATPVADRSGRARGMLIINLHADFMLDQIQQMAGQRGGRAFLFDRSGFFVSRSVQEPVQAGALRRESVEALADTFTRALLTRILDLQHGTQDLGEWIVAYAPITIGRTLAERSDSSMEWSIASSFPRARLFEAVFNLYLLYGVLALCLAATALGGYALSRHLLRPLSALSRETEEIARGNFSHRVEVRGHDEIAGLGQRFNDMAARLEQSYQSLERQRGELADEVRARTMQLERERGNLAAIIENTADGLLELDAVGTIELANGAAQSLFGGAPLRGRHVRELWPQWDAVVAARDGSALAPARHDLHLGERTLSLGVAAVGATAAPQGWIITLRDVSEERRLQDTRRELDRQMFQMEKLNTLGELAMGVAHEIGNPLAGMKAVTQLLQDDAALPAKTRQVLGRIEAEINRLSAFLQTFHGFAAPQQTHPVACRLADVLDDVLLWTRKEARSRGVTIDYAACASEVPPLFADPGQLKQVLLNLVINAVQAMPAGGRVEIGMCARRADLDAAVPRMRFCVRDNGPGIAPEVLPHVFEPFYTTRSDGSGLGLAVVKKIAVQHGADIQVDSVPGRGTRFELAWPVAVDGPVDPEPAADIVCPSEETLHA